MRAASGLVEEAAPRNDGDPDLLDQVAGELAVERRDRGVREAVVEDVLVDLVGDGKRVPLDAEVGDAAELLAAENLTGGIVGRVDDDGLGARIECGRELVRVEAPVRRTQLDV